MTAFWLTDESGAARESFATGETVLVAGSGLLPGALCEFRLDAPGAPSGLLLASLCADRHGTLAPTALLPYFGLTEPGRDGRIQHRSFDEAAKASDGRTLTIRAGQAGTRGAAMKLAVVANGKHPQLMASDASGRLLTGCVRGESDVFVSLRNFPARCVRVLLVPRHCLSRTQLPARLPKHPLAQHVLPQLPTLQRALSGDQVRWWLPLADPAGPMLRHVRH